MIRKSKIKQKPKKKIKINFSYLYILFIVAILGGIYFMWSTSQSTKFTRISGDTWRFVSTINRTVPGPRFGEVIIKSRYPEMDEEQRVTAAIADTMPVKKVTATLTTDTHTSGPYEMLPGSGTSLKSDWTGVWIIKDTYHVRYSLTIQATSDNGTTTLAIPLR